MVSNNHGIMKRASATSCLAFTVILLTVVRQTQASCCLGVPKVCESLSDVEEQGDDEWKSLIIAPGRCENSTAPVTSETLTAQTFANVPKLINVYIVDKTVVLEGNAFKPLQKKLTSLSIIRNRVHEIPTDVFRDLPKLRRLVLRDSGIGIIAAGAFANLPKLEILLLSGNALREINAGILSTVQAKSIDLSFNLISTIDGNAFPDNLIILNLKKNALQQIPDETFSNLGSLEMLILSKNKLKIIRRNTFRGLSNLSKLDLSRNEIALIEPASFADLRELMFLYLKYNQLLIFNADMFQADLINLTDLELEHNNLTFLSKAALDRLPNLEEVTIRGNPWQCSCLHDLLAVLSTRDITISDTTDVSPKCVQNDLNVCTETV